MIMDNLLNVTYIGGPTMIIEIDGIRFMTDPTLDQAGGIYHLGKITLEKIKAPSPIDIGRIDIVLLSHDQHQDNLDNLGRALLEKVSQTYTTVSGSGRLKGSSIGLAPWEKKTIYSPIGTKITITATPARHGPAGIEPITGDVIGFLLSVKRENEPVTELYITGDTTFYEGVREVAQNYNPKYIFIFAGAAQTRGPFNVTMSSNDAIDTALAFPEATIIPLHYEGWKHYTQDEKDIKKSFEVLGIDSRLKILLAGVKTVLK